MSKPTAEQVNARLNTHLAGLPGMFGPASGYAFIVGVLIEQNPAAVNRAIDLHERSLARQKGENP